jgi:hypothetical protein
MVPSSSSSSSSSSAPSWKKNNVSPATSRKTVQSRPCSIDGSIFSFIFIFIFFFLEEKQRFSCNFTEGGSIQSTQQTWLHFLLHLNHLHLLLPGRKTTSLLQLHGRRFNPDNAAYMDPFSPSSSSSSSSSWKRNNVSPATSRKTVQSRPCSIPGSIFSFI